MPLLFLKELVFHQLSLNWVFEIDLSYDIYVLFEVIPDELDFLISHNQ